jgi:hypothetical protein
MIKGLYRRKAMACWGFVIRAPIKGINADTIEPNTYAMRTIPIKPRIREGERGGEAASASLDWRNRRPDLVPSRPLEVIQKDDDLDVLVPEAYTMERRLVFVEPHEGQFISLGLESKLTIIRKVNSLARNYRLYINSVIRLFGLDYPRRGN